MKAQTFDCSDSSLGFKYGHTIQRFSYLCCFADDFYAKVKLCFRM